MARALFQKPERGERDQRIRTTMVKGGTPEETQRPDEMSALNPLPCKTLQTLVLAKCLEALSDKG